MKQCGAQVVGEEPWVNFSPPALSTIEREARLLRKDAACTLATTWRDEDSSVILRTPLEGLIDVVSPDAIQDLVFSLRCTEQALATVLERDDYIHSTLVALSIVELTARELISPTQPTTVRKHLAVAKDLGYFFTPPIIASWMARDVLANQPRVVLEPGAGAGSLLASVLIESKRLGNPPDSLIALEIDPWTSDLCRRLLTNLRNRLSLRCEIQVITVDALEWLEQSENLKSVDAVVMNPPFGRVKFTLDRTTNKETEVADDSQLHYVDKKKEEIARRASQLKDVSEKIGLGRGTQDYQRLFIGLVLNGLRDTSEMVVIAPCAWLGDKASAKLRKIVWDNQLLSKVALFHEDSGLFGTVNQATAVCSFKMASTSAVEVLPTNDQGIGAPMVRLPWSDIYGMDPVLRRFPRQVGPKRFSILQKLRRHETLGDLAWLNNARGELDQTKGKPSMRDKSTDTRLIRGDHVERFTLHKARTSDLPSFVDHSAALEFITEAKAVDIDKSRIVGRQVSYMKKRRRLSFCRVEPPTVIGNSCNYLTVEDDNEESRQRKEYALLGLLNSAVIEFIFRLFSANNHVANYEIDDIPHCFVDSDIVAALAHQATVLELRQEYNEGAEVSGSHLDDIMDAVVAYGFGLSVEDLEYVLANVDKQRSHRACGVLAYLTEHGIPPELMVDAQWPNHELNRLSELDMQMVLHVPPGGNWQHIPESVPSKRLEQIRAMSRERGIVRTTYYGRLRPDQPAYTIATYYNRPGNGTNIHPREDRTLTTREAARLQSFPDYYCFLGTEGSKRKQVGNAVPPLLGMAVGESLLTGSAAAGNCIELFCGAGGLSLGLEFAGWNVCAASDYDAKALATYKLNRLCTESLRGHGTFVRRADLLDGGDVRSLGDELISRLDGRPLDLLIGGPPCQGFSTAGWRSSTDQRNDLAVVFLDMVSRLNPAMVCIENVEGLLNYRKGAVIQELLSALEGLGYCVDGAPWRLQAEQFGVPQMRRRVFIVGSKGVPHPSPPKPFMQRCLGRRESGQQLLLPSDPYPFTAMEALRGLPVLAKESYTDNGVRPVRTLYSQWLIGDLSTTELKNIATHGNPPAG